MTKLKIFFFFTILVISCSQNNKNNSNKNNHLKDFVYLDGTQFKINDNNFFPLMINYISCIRKTNNHYIASPLKGYGLPFQFDSFSEDSIYKTIETHFKIIKEMGFNSIRLIDPGNIKQIDNHLFFQDFSQKKVKLVSIKDHYSEYLGCIKYIVDIAKQFNLKVLFLFENNYVGSIEEDELIKNILIYFKNEPTIFAYDFFNEPLYFDKVFERKKIDALKLVKKWRKMMDEYAPNQLMTIGFSEPIEVFEWDAEILPVDFLAFHTYNPLRIPNEIYWYSHYIHKPWVIGETGLAADNDSVPYERQSAFIKQTYQYALNCGSSGFGLWQFQDVLWGRWRQNYKGLLSNEGTITIDNFTIHGSLKPAASIIKDLHKLKPNYSNCKQPGNYFNMRDYHNFLITGKVIDEATGKPIEGAVIRGWNKNWRWGTNTFTDSTGKFWLYSQWKFTHFRISAPTYDRIKFDFDGSYTLTEAGKHTNLYPDSMQRRIMHLTGNEFYNYNHRNFYYAFKETNMGVRKLQKLDL